VANPDIEQPLIQAQSRNSSDHRLGSSHSHQHGSGPDDSGHNHSHDHVDMQQEHNSGVGDGGLRAAVFGFLDGLVSNLCLILGVYSAVESGDTSVRTLLVTGIAGLMAGAASMSSGEWCGPVPFSFFPDLFVALLTELTELIE
jgi:hypothetical protein